MSDAFLARQLLRVRTDRRFLQEFLSAMEKSEEEIVLVKDGGYDGQDNIAIEKYEKHVKLAITALTGREEPDEPADFEFNEEGICLLKCAIFIISKNGSNRTNSQRYMKGEKFRNLSKLRNGIDALNFRKVLSALWVFAYSQILLQAAKFAL